MKNEQVECGTVSSGLGVNADGQVGHEEQSRLGKCSRFESGMKDS
jgi:hypothetical protein